jgi:hypothetical protein
MLVCPFENSFLTHFESSVSSSWRSVLYICTSFRRGRDHVVVGFTTTYAISAYHH